MPDQEDYKTGEYVIDEAAFLDMTVKRQNLVTFQTLNKFMRKCDRQFADQDSKILFIDRKVDKRRLVNMSVSGMAGLFGGFLAVITKNIFGKS